MRLPGACYNEWRWEWLFGDNVECFALLFRKCHKAGASSDAGDMGEPGGEPEVYRIDYDMMLKGSIATRRGKPIRQYGVTVDGATRLITSGDTVDRKTYEALVAAGAIRSALRPAPDSPGTPERERREG